MTRRQADSASLQGLELPEKYQDHIVLVPFNEPEGKMYGEANNAESFWKESWLDNPTWLFDMWDRTYRMIKDKLPEARIPGSNKSILFGQVCGFLEHTVAENTVAKAMTWHELSNPAAIRSSVDTYRTWEREIFAGGDGAA